MTDVVLPFPAYEPDRAVYNKDATNEIINAVPRADGWGPLAAFVEVTEALPSAPKGSFDCLASDGTYHSFVGTATDLYKLDTSTTPYPWDEVSKSTAAYTLPDGHKWSFEIIGDTVYAAHQGDVIQSYTIGVSTVFADVADSPRARQIFSSGDFLVALNLENDITKIKWSADNDPTFWTPGIRNSGEQNRPLLGEAMFGISDPRGGIIVGRKSQDYMIFDPASGYVFTFAPANPSRGIISPLSVASFNPGQYAYLSRDGFYVGARGEPIGAERVDDTFLADIDEDYYDDVQATIDPFEQIIWWRYYSIDAVHRQIGWNWNLNRWTYSDQQIIDARPMTKAAVTWDGLDALYATIDDIDLPFDSRFFKGGQPVYAGFTVNNKLAYSTGAPQLATITTGRAELIPGRRTFINVAKVQTDADNFTLQPGTFEHNGDEVVWGTPVSPEPDNFDVPLLSEGRLHRERLIIPAGTDWSEVSNVLLDVQDAGDA